MAPLPLLHTSFTRNVTAQVHQIISWGSHHLEHPEATPVSEQDKKTQATTAQSGWFLPTLLIQAAYPEGRHGFTRGSRELHSPTQRPRQVSGHREQRLVLPSSLPGFTHQLQKLDGGHCPPRFLPAISFITAKNPNPTTPTPQNPLERSKEDSEKHENLLLVTDSGKAESHRKASNCTSTTTAGTINNTRVTQ